MKKLTIDFETVFDLSIDDLREDIKSHIKDELSVVRSTNFTNLLDDTYTVFLNSSLKNDVLVSVEIKATDLYGHDRKTISDIVKYKLVESLKEKSEKLDLEARH